MEDANKPENDINELTYKEPANDVGMCGDAELRVPDIKTSRSLLTQFSPYISGFESAIDLAGGIGRVARQVLKPKFAKIDLLDLNADYIH